MKNCLFICLFLSTLFTACVSNNSEKAATFDVDTLLIDPLTPEDYLFNRQLEEINISPQKISELDSTIFIPTMAKTFNKSENAIYAATLCLAWQEIDDTLGEIYDIEHPDLELMNNANNYQNVLSKDEYTTTVSYERTPDSYNSVSAMAYFKKSLPFSEPLTRYVDSLSFDGEVVESFGFRGKGNGGIHYYHSDDDFAIRLFPKDSEHEIILLKKPFSDSVSFEQEFEALNETAKLFNEKKSEKNEWMYSFEDEDQVKIPTTAFKLEHDFPQITGSSFNEEGHPRPWRIRAFFQQNGFMLNENGAIVESYAYAEGVDSIGFEVPEDIKPHPKSLLFDTDYIIFLKRKDAEYPYFALFVANTELLNKK